MTEPVRIIIENLESWSLGFLMGFAACTLVCRVVLRHRHPRKEDPVSSTPGFRPERQPTIVGGVVTLLVAATIGSVVWVAENYTDGAAEVWNMCRHINYPLGCLVAVGVTYRLVLMAFDRARWTDARAMHLLLWFAYIAGNLLAAALTSHHYEVVGVDATWVSGFRTCLMTGGLALTVWWPHPHRFTPIEEHR